MVFHVVAFRNPSLGTTEAVIPPVRDETILYDNEGIMVPNLNKVLWLYGEGLGLANLRLDAPSLRAICIEEIDTFNPGDGFPVVTVVNEAGTAQYRVEPTYGIKDYGASPLTLTAGEKLVVKGNVATGTSNTYVVMCLGDGVPTPVTGNVRTIKGTVNVTTTANEWSSGTITLTQSLAVGTYDVVGAIIPSPQVIAFRLIFTGAGWRPGIIGCDFNSVEILQRYLCGNFGVWGSFVYNQVPQCELLTRSSISNPTIYLQLIKRA